jgi:hypothetical protein
MIRHEMISRRFKALEDEQILASWLKTVWVVGTCGYRRELLAEVAGLCSGTNIKLGMPCQQTQHSLARIAARASHRYRERDWPR